MHAKTHLRLLLISLCTWYLIGCSSVSDFDSMPERPASYALPSEDADLLNRFFEHQPSADLSGFYPLIDGLDAFAARIALAEAAQTSIDIQYYLYHRQETGKVLSAYLLKAAERGIRVRILLDDMSQAESERDLAALARHDNIQVRLFNPLNHRKLRFLSFITDYSRVSRRMHNKSFIVDSQVFITGGRNIGNAYFSGEDSSQFVDLDVLSIGPVVEKATQAFDLYWNHPLAEDIDKLFTEVDDGHLDTLKGKLAYFVSREYGDSSPYVKRVKESDLVQSLRRGKLNLDWARGYLYVDDPNKLLTDSRNTSTHMAPKMIRALGVPKQQAIIISPYFVPREPGMALLRRWAEQGVKITILTNSLSATDVPVVHAGYAGYRKELLAMGVNLWELKRNFEVTPKKLKIKSFTGSSAASLHAKTMAFDNDQVFIGSLNLDPRSFNLNTEQGLVITSPRFNRLLRRWVENEMPKFAWQLSLDAEGQLQWQSVGSEKVYDHDPDTSRWQRFSVWLMSLLPIEGVL